MWSAAAPDAQNAEAKIASRLVQAGATVDVALTPSATQFVQPLAFRSLTGREPYIDMFRPHGTDGEAHVELARHGAHDDIDALLALPKHS